MRDELVTLYWEVARTPTEEVEELLDEEWTPVEAAVIGAGVSAGNTYD